LRESEKPAPNIRREGTYEITSIAPALLSAMKVMRVSTTLPIQYVSNV
jgi:hypothetical protein